MDGTSRASTPCFAPRQLCARIRSFSLRTFRSILQLPVWQEWLFSLLYTHPSSPDERHLTDLVLAVCHMLIMHAVKYEYGGWCVWIDSMALLHYKVGRLVLGHVYYSL